jgi:hypothetical protein
LADHHRPLTHERCHLLQLIVLLEACPQGVLVGRPLLLGLQDEPGELTGRWERGRRW